MRTWIFTALIASLALAAQANDAGDLSLKSKVLAAAGASAGKDAQAPFAYGRDPMPQLLMMDEQERRGPQGSCEFSAHDLCYDLADRRIVYRPARAWMPKFEGLQPENVTLRTNRIVFKYSFK